MIVLATEELKTINSFTSAIELITGERLAVLIVPWTYSVPQDGLGSGLANAEDVLQRNLNPLAVGDLNVVHTQVLHPQRAAPGGSRLERNAECKLLSHPRCPACWLVCCQ